MVDLRQSDILNECRTRIDSCIGGIRGIRWPVQIVAYLNDQRHVGPQPITTQVLLPKKTQELVMILTARSMDCQYIWHAHSARSRGQGISDEFVDALRDQKPLPKLPAEEQVVVDYVLELFQTHKTTQATFDAAMKQLGAPGLTELTTLMGYYTTLAFNANSFLIDIPDGAETKLPI